MKPLNPPLQLSQTRLFLRVRSISPKRCDSCLNMVPIPSASLKAKFRYDVVQNLKLGDDGSHTCERSPLFLPGTKTLASEIVSHTEYTIEFVPKIKRHENTRVRNRFSHLRDVSAPRGDRDVVWG